MLCSFRVFGNLAGFSSFKDISPTFQVELQKINGKYSSFEKSSQRHLFGLSSIVSQSLPGIIIPAIMGIFGTTKHAQWKQQLPLNSSVVNNFNLLYKQIYKYTSFQKYKQVIISNLLYIIFISTDHASWEPALGTHRSMDSILERFFCLLLLGC